MQYQFKESYIREVLGIEIPLNESAKYSPQFQLRVLNEHRRFEKAMRLDEGFWDSLKNFVAPDLSAVSVRSSEEKQKKKTDEEKKDTEASVSSVGKSALKGIMGSLTDMKNLSKALVVILKDPKKIVQLISHLQSQIQTIFSKIYKFVDSVLGIAGFWRSLATKAGSKANKIVSKGLKIVEKFVEFLKKWTVNGLKAFKGLSGWQKALFGIGLIMGGDWLYKEYFKKLHPLTESSVSAIASWTEDDSVLAAFELSALKIEGEDMETVEYIIATLPDGKPAKIPKKFWKTKEFKNFIESVAKWSGGLLKGMLEKMAINGLMNAATGGIAPLLKLIVKGWELGKTATKYLSKTLETFLQEEAAKDNKKDDKSEEKTEEIKENIRLIYREMVLGKNPRYRSKQIVKA